MLVQQSRQGLCASLSGRSWSPHGCAVHRLQAYAQVTVDQPEKPSPARHSVAQGRSHPLLEMGQTQGFVYLAGLGRQGFDRSQISGRSPWPRSAENTPSETRRSCNPPGHAAGRSAPSGRIGRNCSRTPNSRQVHRTWISNRASGWSRPDAADTKTSPAQGSLCRSRA